jgi:hypothetical protein
MFLTGVPFNSFAADKTEKDPAQKALDKYEAEVLKKIEKLPVSSRAQLRKSLTKAKFNIKRRSKKAVKRDNQDAINILVAVNKYPRKGRTKKEKDNISKALEIGRKIIKGEDLSKIILDELESFVEQKLIAGFSVWVPGIGQIYGMIRFAWSEYQQMLAEIHQSSIKGMAKQMVHDEFLHTKKGAERDEYILHKYLKFNEVLSKGVAVTREPGGQVRFVDLEEHNTFTIRYFMDKYGKSISTHPNFQKNIGWDPQKPLHLQKDAVSWVMRYFYIKEVLPVVQGKRKISAKKQDIKKQVASLEAIEESLFDQKYDHKLASEISKQFKKWIKANIDPQMKSKKTKFKMPSSKVSLRKLTNKTRLQVQKKTRIELAKIEKIMASVDKKVNDVVPFYTPPQPTTTGDTYVPDSQKITGGRKKIDSVTVTGLDGKTRTFKYGTGQAGGAVVRDHNFYDEPGNTTTYLAQNSDQRYANCWAAIPDKILNKIVKNANNINEFKGTVKIQIDYDMYIDITMRDNLLPYITQTLNNLRAGTGEPIVFKIKHATNPKTYRKKLNKRFSVLKAYSQEMNYISKKAKPLKGVIDNAIKAINNVPYHGYVETDKDIETTKKAAIKNLETLSKMLNTSRLFFSESIKEYEGLRAEVEKRKWDLDDYDTDYTKLSKLLKALNKEMKALANLKIKIKSFKNFASIREKQSKLVNNVYLAAEKIYPFTDRTFPFDDVSLDIIKTKMEQKLNDIYAKLVEKIADENIEKNNKKYSVSKIDFPAIGEGSSLKSINVTSSDQDKKAFKKKLSSLDKNGQKEIKKIQKSIEAWNKRKLKLKDVFATMAQKDSDIISLTAATKKQDLKDNIYQINETLRDLATLANKFEANMVKLEQRTEAISISGPDDESYDTEDILSKKKKKKKDNPILGQDDKEIKRGYDENERKSDDGNYDEDTHLTYDDELDIINDGDQSDNDGFNLDDDPYDFDEDEDFKDITDYKRKPGGGGTTIRVDPYRNPYSDPNYRDVLIMERFTGKNGSFDEQGYHKWRKAKEKQWAAYLKQKKIDDERKKAKEEQDRKWKNEQELKKLKDTFEKKPSINYYHRDTHQNINLKNLEILAKSQSLAHSYFRQAETYMPIYLNNNLGRAQVMYLYLSKLLKRMESDHDEIENIIMTKLTSDQQSKAEFFLTKSTTLFFEAQAMFENFTNQMERRITNIEDLQALERYISIDKPFLYVINGKLDSNNNGMLDEHELVDLLYDKDPNIVVNSATIKLGKVIDLSTGSSGNFGGKGPIISLGRFGNANRLALHGGMILRMGNNPYQELPSSGYGTLFLYDLVPSSVWGMKYPPNEYVKIKIISVGPEPSVYFKYWYKKDGGTF